MKFFKKVMAVAVGTAVIATSAFTALAATYSTNGGFEETNEAGTEVPGWGCFAGWDTVEIVGKDAAHSGEHAIKIPQADFEIYIAQFDAWVKDKIDAYDPSKPAVFSMWVKYENVTDEGFYLRAERKYDGGASVLDDMGENITGSSDWVKVELVIDPADHEMHEVGVGIMVRPGSGTVWIDDASYLNF